MRASYLAADRPDIQFTFKECARAMARPTLHAFEHLKHLARYLNGKPKLVWSFPRQCRVTTLKAFADSNWAGCVGTRRSTSSFALRIGRHCIATGSYTQTPIGLSSGEAEFYASVKAACRGLGLKALASDRGWDLSLELEVDSSACKGICARRGAGFIRHIETPTL